ncbi:MAG: hypothetical protein ACFFCP_07665 [Promethearchaeota archaeon]
MFPIKVRLSKIQFPEVCPVCLAKAEDLVFVTILERAQNDFDASSWDRGLDKTKVALEAAQGATMLAVPTCMRHGSRSVRTLKTKLIAVLGFFILFYPILFFVLQIDLALTYSRELFFPLLGALVTSSALVLFILYGFFPRALERALRFHDVKRVKDSLFISISNPVYQNLFLKLNGMFVSDSPLERNENE